MSLNPRHAFLALHRRHPRPSGVGADPCSARDALSLRHRDPRVVEIVCSCCERNPEQADVTSRLVQLFSQGTR